MDIGIQYAIIIGAIIIIMALIVAMSRPNINMDSHDKIQTSAILGLAIIAISALIISINVPDSQNLITLAGVAVGGIAGFITQKSIQANNTALFTPGDQVGKVGETIKFILTGINSAGNVLNYSMTSIPDVSGSAILDANTGAFEWKPDSTGDYIFTFTLTDSQGGTDTKTIKIRVE